MSLWDLPEKEKKFADVLTRIVTDTVKLDIIFGQMINLYFGNNSRFDEFNDEILEMSASKKAALVDYIAKKKNLPQYPNGFLEVIKSCLKIRNTLVHTLGIEEDVSGKKEKVFLFKKGKQKLKIPELESNFYENYNLIISNCVKLRRLLWVEVVSTDIKSCNILFEKGNADLISLLDVTLKNSQGKTATIYDVPKRIFNGKNWEAEIKKEVKEYLSKLYPYSKDREFTIYVSELEIPEPDYPEPEE